jgi:hypothetical protein
MITKTPVYQPRLVNRGFEEATTGFEPVIRVLQTHALPLGHVAKTKPAGYAPAGHFLERAKRFELSTFSLARRRSTAELHPRKFQ